MPVGVSRANANKAIRQTALREQLAAQGHVQHVVDLLGEVQALGADDLNPVELQRYKLVIDTKLALIKKYLPDPKQVELSTPDDKPFQLENCSTKELEAIIARGQE